MRDEEFDEFFVARAPRLRRVAYAIVHDWQLAEDAVQAAFVKIYLRWRRIKPVTVEAYVRRAVVNTSISFVRKSHREVVSGAVPDHAVPTAESEPDLLAALQVLPPAQRAVIALRFLDDLSVKDVAAVLKISDGAVKSQTARGLATLRTSMPQTEADLL